MRFTLTALVLILLAGCASGPNYRFFPPGAALQEIRVLPNGQWALALLVQNNARLGIRVSGFEGTLSIDGVEAARFAPATDLQVAANGAERIELQLTPAPAAAGAVTQALAASRGIAYVIEGTLSTSDPAKRSDPFRFESRLNPAPGLDGTLR